jgi:hypothetical protein
MGGERPSPDFGSAYSLATQLRQRAPMLREAWALVKGDRSAQWAANVHFILQTLPISKKRKLLPHARADIGLAPKRQRAGA